MEIVFIHNINKLGLEPSWIEQENISDKSKLIKYINAYYFVIITMNTVGYGDIHPQNLSEKVKEKLLIIYKFFSIFFVFFACLIFAYSLNSIGIFMQEIYKKQTEYRKKVNTINGFMRKNNICLDLRMRIQKYLEYIWKEEGSASNEDEYEIINKLSINLKKELMIESNLSVLKALKIFSKNDFSDNVLIELVNVIKEVRFPPGDIIFNTESNSDCSLYIVQKGGVEIYQNNIDERKVMPVKVLKPGQIFGEISFFTSQPRSSYALSNNYTTLLKIEQGVFIDLIKKFPLDYEKFCKIKDDIILNQNFESIDVKCYSCRETNHTISKCPLLHHIPSKTYVLAKYTYSEDQIRKVYERKFKKFNSLLNKKLIKEKLEPLRAEFVKFLEEFEDDESEVDMDMTDNSQFTSEPNLEKLNSSNRKISEKDFENKSSNVFDEESKEENEFVRNNEEKEFVMKTSIKIEENNNNIDNQSLKKNVRFELDSSKLDEPSSKKDIFQKINSNQKTNSSGKLTQIAQSISENQKSNNSIKK